MLDYKDIIIKHYALNLSGSKISGQIGASKTEVNDFLKAFKECEGLQYPFPQTSRTTTSRYWCMNLSQAKTAGTRTSNFRTMPRQRS